MNRIWQFLITPLKKLASAPRKLITLSLPAQIAILVFFFLALVVSFVLVIWLLYQERFQLRAGHLVVLSLVGIAISFVTYWTLKLWLEGDVSRYPDIDQAWNAGVAELTRNNIDIRETPLFLIVGSPNEILERSLFEASRLRFRFQEIPHGPAALHWYANPDGIYLVCTETCCLGKLASAGYKIALEEPVAAQAAKAAPKVDPLRGTIMPGAIQADDPIRGTVAPSEQDLPGRAAITTSGPMEPRARGKEAGPANIRGTMVISGTTATPGEDDFAAAPEKKVATLPPAEATEQSRRLDYVCQLLRRARQPLCAINGLLTLLPFGIIQSGLGGAREVQRATRMDLTSLRRGLRLRFPITTLVIGMESESGFRELVRRVGRDRASAQRFGKGFDKDQIWNDPTPQRIEATIAHACGAFEDWVYALFKERGSLGKEPGNKKLFALLCKVRRDLKDRLANLLIAVCGHSAEDDHGDDAWLFGGTYFSATGDREERQAFVSGVFEKLPEQQEEVEWTQDAIRKDRFYRVCGYYALGLDVAVVVGLGVLYFLTRVR